MAQPEHDEPELREGVPDTGDLIDPTASDPTDDEVTDRNDPSWVEPALNVQPIPNPGGSG